MANDQQKPTPEQVNGGNQKNPAHSEFHHSRGVPPEKATEKASEAGKPPPEKK